MNHTKHFYLRSNQTLLANSNLTDKAKASIISAKSENTIDAYEADWKDFMDWCDYKHITDFPPTSETIVNYINDLADHAKANTISRRISAISENLNAAGLDNNPTSSPLVRSALRGIRRMKGTYQQGKTPVLLMDLEEIFETMPKMGLQGLVEARDKAILLTGFMGAFRRSELCAIEVEDIRFLPQGMEIFIASSKADQEGQGSSVAIPYIDRPELCAVRAVKHWLSLSHIVSGPIFRPFKKNGELRTSGISDKSISDIVKKYMEAIGEDPSFYGAHSLRHGFATTAASYGVEERNIMRQTRHHSVNMVRRYINEASKFDDNAIHTIFKK